MVGQAGEGLGADNIGRAAVNQFQHLSGEEPSLPCLVAHRYNGTCHFGQFFNTGRGGKMPALSKRFVCRSADFFNSLNGKIGHVCCGFFCSQVLGLEVLIVKAVAHEVN